MSSKYQKTIVIRKIRRRLDKLPLADLKEELFEAYLENIFTKNIYELETLLDDIDKIITSLRNISYRKY